MAAGGTRSPNGAGPPATASAIVEIARAKVNLTLRVLGRRPDGFHALESLVAFADVGDRLTLTPGAATTLAVTGPFAAAIQGPNLLATALDLLRAADPGFPVGAVVLDKQLPVASGVGGGSSDAAALLRALRRAAPERAALVDWSLLARRLGADVPVCLLDRAALIEGTGERLTPLDGMAPVPAVLANPLLAMPPDKTARVFRRLAAKALAEAAPPAAAAAMVSGVQDLVALLQRLERTGNDLEPAAVALWPQIAEVRDRLARTAGARHVRLSGAGATWLAVYDSAAAAASAAAALRAARGDWWIVATTLG